MEDYNLIKDIVFSLKDIYFESIDPKDSFEEGRNLGIAEAIIAVNGHCTSFGIDLEKVGLSDHRLNRIL